MARPSQKVQYVRSTRLVDHKSPFFPDLEDHQHEIMDSSSQTPVGPLHKPVVERITGWTAQLAESCRVNVAHASLLQRSRNRESALN